MSENSPYRLRDALSGFEARGVKLPAAVTEAVDRWRSIKDRTPADKPPNVLRDAILGGADQDELDRLLLHDLGAGRIRTAYTQAALSAAAAALRAIMDERDAIHKQLAKQADKAIADLETVAALGETSLDTLVRAGRPEAKVFADRQIIGAELAALYRLRDDCLIPGGLKAARAGYFDCTQWADPTVVNGKLTASSVVDNYLVGLNAGGRLWFPTAEQALTAAQPLHDEWRREAERIAAEQRSQGGVAAFW